MATTDAELFAAFVRDRPEWADLPEAEVRKSMNFASYALSVRMRELGITVLEASANFRRTLARR